MIIILLLIYFCTILIILLIDYLRCPEGTILRELLEGSWDDGDNSIIGTFGSFLCLVPLANTVLLVIILVYGFWQYLVKETKFLDKRIK